MQKSFSLCCEYYDSECSKKNMCPFREVKKGRQESIWAHKSIEGISALKQE